MSQLVVMDKLTKSGKGPAEATSVVDVVDDGALCAGDRDFGLGADRGTEVACSSDRFELRAPTCGL
jgi:hypothetical protein